MERWVGGVAIVVFEPRPCRHNKRPNEGKQSGKQCRCPLLFATRRPDCTEKQAIVKTLSVLFFPFLEFQA